MGCSIDGMKIETVNKKHSNESAFRSNVLFFHAFHVFLKKTHVFIIFGTFFNIFRGLLFGGIFGRLMDA